MSPLVRKLASWWFVVPLVALLSLPLCHFVTQIEFTPIVEQRGATAVVVHGELCRSNDCRPALMFHGGVTQVSMELLRAKLVQSPKVSWVCLASPGGEGDYARDLVSFLRERQVGTCAVPRQQDDGHLEPIECGSACSFLWLGGAQRVLAPDGASIGFHQSYFGPYWCCTLSNVIKAGLARWAVWRDGVNFGDAPARAELYRKGSSCGPHEFYRLRVPEASRLRLVGKEGAAAGWFWRPVASGTMFQELPRAQDCS